MGDSGRDGRDAVLDLSAWPQPPAAGPVRRASLPPRPVRRRRLPAVGARGIAASGLGSLVLGAGLLAVPLPASGCPSPLSVWTSGPRSLASLSGPALDETATTADRRAVDAARAALAAHDAQLAAARRALGTPGPAPTRRPVAATRSTAALEQAVRDDRTDRDRAKAALDRVVEQQQASADPSSYDAEVAAAQEDLDVAEARLADDQRALAAARASPVATVPSASPAPTGAAARDGAQTVVDQGPAVHAGLVQELAHAQQAQSQHLRTRRDQLAGWAGRHAHEVAAVRAGNAHLAACGGSVRVPAAVGSFLGLGGVGLLVRRRRWA